MTFCPVLCGLLLWTRPSVSFAPREIDKQPFCHVPPVRPNQTCKLFPRFLVRLNLHESKHNTFFFLVAFFQMFNRLFQKHLSELSTNKRWNNLLKFCGAKCAAGLPMTNKQHLHHHIEPPDQKNFRGILTFQST